MFEFNHLQFLGRAADNLLLAISVLRHMIQKLLDGRSDQLFSGRLKHSYGNDCNDSVAVVLAVALEIL